eukprot:s2444_g3.t1
MHCTDASEKERTTLVATPGQKPSQESRGPGSTAYVSSSPRIRWGSTDIVVTTPLKFCEELAHFKEDGLFPACVVMDEADALFQGFTRVYLFEIFGALRPRPKIRQADEERQRLPDMIPTQRRAQIHGHCGSSNSESHIFLGRAHESSCSSQQMTAMPSRVSFRQYGLPPVSLDFSWRHVSVVLLSFDELNPVKVLCSYTSWFMGFSEVHLGVFASLLLLALGINQRDHILYNCARTVLLARKSYDRPFVGFLARAFHCIPVARPQDMAYTGQGTIKLEQGSAKVQGIDTHFSVEVPPGSQINVQGHEKLLKVKEVQSNTELTVDVPATCSAAAGFKVHPKVDQSAMYEQVYKNLCSGNCLGIFPEGGSHDRTDLLPLKAGVAVIALEALRRHHINVPIVPVGLNYFRGHQFGGRVAACMNWPDADHGFGLGRFPDQVMEFGAPLMSQSCNGQSSYEEWDFHMLALSCSSGLVKAWSWRPHCGTEGSGPWPWAARAWPAPKLRERKRRKRARSRASRTWWTRAGRQRTGDPETKQGGVSQTVIGIADADARTSLPPQQDGEAGDKNSRLAALAAWNAAADAERLEASMRRRHSTKQREIPALGRAIRIAEKNAPRGHYDVLQLPRKATPEDIQKSFRKRALVTHPDKGGRPEDFQAVVTAFEVLTNSQHREEYDRSLNATGNTDGGMDAGSFDMDAVTDMGSEELAARRAVREALIRLCSASPAEQKRILKELQTEVLEEAMEFLQSAHAKSAWNMEFTQFRNAEKSNSLSMAGYRTSPAMYLSFYCDWGEDEGKRQTITPATSDLSLAVKIKHRYDDIFAQEEEALAEGGKSSASGHKLRALKREVATWIEQELQEEFAVLKIMAAELRNRHKKAEREDWREEAQSAIELRDLTGLHTSVAKLKYLDTEQKSATRSLLVGNSP